MTIRTSTTLLAACLLLLSLSQFPSTTNAHSIGAPRLTNSPAGPYLVTVWLPEAAAANEEFHVTVGVVSAAEPDKGPILDANILVHILAQGSVDPVATAAATTEQSTNKLLYEAQLLLHQTGNYKAEIVVMGSQGIGKASVDLELLVRAGQTWLDLGLPAVALGVAVFFFWRSRTEGKRKLGVDESSDRLGTFR